MRKFKRPKRPRPTTPAPFKIYVDADACPVKQEVYRVAERYRSTVYLVSNQPLRAPSQLGLVVKVIQVDQGADEADRWIFEHIEADDICVTSDLPLAAKCIDKEGIAITPRGRVFNADTIADALANRDLMTSLRETDWGGTEVPRGGPPPMTQKTRSNFLNSLDRAVQKSLKAHKLRVPKKTSSDDS